MGEQVAHRWEAGQGSVEYGLILFLVVMTGLLGLTLYSNSLGTTWANTIARITAIL